MKIHILQLFSTESGLAKVVTDPLLVFNCEHVADLVQFDVSASFDTIDHEMN